MTRINVVPPKELHNKHLMGEIHEITRVFGLVRKAQERGINKYNFKEKLNPPDTYTMGTGHVKFFYNKLDFIKDRYQKLCYESWNRGYKVVMIDPDSLGAGLRKEWYNDYTPDDNALNINRERIRERMPK